MKYYVISEYELTRIKESIDRLYELRMLIPGAAEHAVKGIEARRPLIAEMLANIEQPDNLHSAICTQLGSISSTMCIVQSRHPLDLL